jgi:hypothetical protein
MNSEGQVHLHLIDDWIKSMYMPDIRKIALKMGLKFRNMGKTQLIRLIQRAEGNKECFGTQDTCDFRIYRLKEGAADNGRNGAA